MSNFKNKILLVEDDLNFGAVMQSYMKMNDYVVNWVNDGKQAIPEFNSDKYDLCILDVMLPNVDGFTIAKEIRKINTDIPIIFLTAKTLKDDVIEGFKSGADDYITKPFDSDILLMKINAILKRKSVIEELQALDQYEIGSFIYETHTRILRSKIKERTLSPKEGELLKLLCMNMNNVLDRELTLIKIWGENSYFTTRSMDVYITKLRKYFKDDSDIKITNVHGSGYILHKKN